MILSFAGVRWDPARLGRSPSEELDSLPPRKFVGFQGARCSPVDDNFQTPRDLLLVRLDHISCKFRARQATEGRHVSS